MIEESEIQKLLHKLLNKEISVFECAFQMHNARCKKTRENAKLALACYCKMRGIDFNSLPD